MIFCVVEAASRGSFFSIRATMSITTATTSAASKIPTTAAMTLV